MPSQQTPDEFTIKLSVTEINLILEALGSLPFARVHELIGSIQRQARAQMQAAQTAETKP